MICKYHTQFCNCVERMCTTASFKMNKCYLYPRQQPDMKQFYLLVGALLCGISLFGQQGRLTGKVQDASTGDPLIGATVVTAQMLGVSTDIDGAFILDVPAGVVEYSVSYVGYVTQKYSLTVEAGQEYTILVDLVLEEGLLNTIVVTGSKFEKKLGEETVTIDVIKSDLIEHTNDVRLDQSVQRMPGVSVIDGQANIRGGSGYSYGAGSRVLLLMDDLPVLTGDAAFPSWDFIPIENIQQVEIIKGASSALYGSSALNGIIHVRTAYPTSTPETKFSFFNGGYFSPADTAQKWWGDDFPFMAGANFAHKQKFGRFDLVTGSYIYAQNSYLKDIYNRRGRINMNTRYRISSNFSVGLNVNAQMSRSANFFFWNNADSGLYIPAEGTVSLNQGFKITVDPFIHYFDQKGNRHKLLSRYYGNHNETPGVEQSNFSDLYYAEYQYQKHIEAINLVLTSGILANQAHVSAALYGDSTYTAANQALYIQADKKMFNKLNLSAGMRYEFNQIGTLQESRPVFRAGANYQLADYTYLRASWGQGYRFPTIAEKYISTGISGLSIFPNPDLTSETGYSAEVGVKQGLRISNWQGMLDASAFISEYADMMEFTFGYYNTTGTAIAPGFKSLNIGDTRIQGFEVSFIGQGKLGSVPTSLILGYTYIDPTFQVFDSLQDALSSADYNVLKYRFRHTIKFDIESTFKQFRIGVTCNYNSFMEAVDAAFVDPIIPAIDLYIIEGLQDYRDEHNTGDYVVDIRMAYVLKNSNEISLICANLLNRTYSLRPAMMEAPRNIMVKYSVRL